MGFFEKIVSFLKDRIQKLTDEEKKRIVFICTAVVSVMLILSVVLSLKGHKKEEPPPEQDISRRIAIPPGEIFLPDEPDFVPGVFLERERRSNWTEEDASVFWQDPLRNGEEEWREKIEAAIDEFLENVP